MASLRKRRNKWYARVRLFNVERGTNTEKLIPLRTDSKVTARVRLAEVMKVEKDIKSGISFSFAWLNDEGKTKVLRLSIADAFEKYKHARLIDMIRPSTITRHEYAVNTLYSIVNESLPIKNISATHIDNYKEFWSSKISPQTININLSKFHAFFNWCLKKGMISELPLIEPLVVTSKPVSYLSDTEFQAIMSIEALENHFKRAFLFYRETGCRLREPFEGEINGNWLIINPDKAKTHRTREIELSPLMHQILDEMILRYEKLNSSPYNYKPRSIAGRYSKVFKDACREIGSGDRKFHNLRDTFAIRLWAITGDIHYVSKVIGHTSVTMTEKYANFNVRRLISDFPSLSKYIEKRLNIPKMGIVDTFSVDTKLLNGLSLEIEPSR